MTVIVGFMEWLWGRSPLEALGLVAIVMILWFGALELLAKWKVRKRAGSEQETTAPIPVKDASVGGPTKADPKPVFGSPRQGATEDYLSWPHIPVTVDMPDGEIRDCKIELIRDEEKLNVQNKQPIGMRWQSSDLPQGVEEITLRGWQPRMVPTAIRCETGRAAEIHPLPISDGIGRITGSAYLKDKEVNKFLLSPGRHLFRLRVLSPKNNWDSQHRYCLNVPEKTHSNGQFYLEIWNEGKG